MAHRHQPRGQLARFARAAEDQNLHSAALAHHGTGAIDDEHVNAELFLHQPAPYRALFVRV